MDSLTKALFVSLDDTLITTRTGNKYPLHSKDWKINIEAVNIIKTYMKLNYKVIILSNQFGIAKGFTTTGLINKKLEEICTIIETELQLYSKIAYFIATGKDAYANMPMPGMVYDAALEYELDLVNSIILGNTVTDIELSKITNIKLITT